MKTSVEKVPDLCESQEDNCKKVVDKIIKTNREVFIMCSLLEKQMCGYDIIKEIFSRCDVFLSQGTVYPILYTLEGFEKLINRNIYILIIQYNILYENSYRFCHSRRILTG